MIQTASGRMFSVVTPDASALDIDDIAHALAHQCRFSGHVRRFYSVAEHCVRVSRCVHWIDARSALMHDAAEAYVADVPSPIKRLPEMAAYREIERGVERVIAERWQLDYPWNLAVKYADEAMLGLEARTLMPTFASPESWQPFLSRPTPEQMTGVTLGLKPREAKQLFLKRASELGIK